MPDYTPPTISLAYNQTFPGTAPVFGAVWCDYQVGYGDDAEDVPEPIREAVRVLATHLFEHRGDEQGVEVPDAVRSLLWPYRILEF